MTYENLNEVWPLAVGMLKRYEMNFLRSSTNITKSRLIEIKYYIGQKSIFCAKLKLYFDNIFGDLTGRNSIGPPVKPEYLLTAQEVEEVLGPSVHVNGKLSIELRPGVTERINI